jgi:hypothetical protein
MVSALALSLSLARLWFLEMRSCWFLLWQVVGGKPKHDKYWKPPPWINRRSLKGLFIWLDLPAQWAAATNHPAPLQSYALSRWLQSCNALIREKIRSQTRRDICKVYVPQGCKGFFLNILRNYGPLWHIPNWEMQKRLNHNQLEASLMRIPWREQWVSTCCSSLVVCRLV